MAPQLEKKILNKLNRIEDLLVQIVPQRTELTEEEVLKIIKEGDKELREGKTENLESFLEREYPQYASKHRTIR